MKMRERMNSTLFNMVNVFFIYSVSMRACDKLWAAVVMTSLAVGLCAMGCWVWVSLVDYCEALENYFDAGLKGEKQ